MRASRVVVEFKGGLGNQLFQLAAGMDAASYRGQNRIEADLRHYGQVRLRDFQLRGRFGSYAVVPTKRPLAPTRAGVPAAVARRLAYGLPGVPTIAQEGTSGSARQLRGKSPVHLRGYWHETRCAMRSARDLRDGIWALAKMNKNPEFERLAAVAQSSPYIGVHVRRGDYLHPPASEQLGTLSYSYYARGLQYVSAQLGGHPLMVVSDDPAYAERLAQRERGDVVSVALSPVEDLALLSLCRGHVLSNSTFSWWGAVLAGSAVVAAPDPWYLQPPVDTIHDLVPSDWRRIPR